MPEINSTTSPQAYGNVSQTTKKPLNWKLIGIIAVIAAIVIGGLGYAAVVLDIFGTKKDETQTHVKQASPSAKVQTINELFAFSRDLGVELNVATGSAQTKGNEVWIYNLGKVEQVTNVGSVGKFEQSKDGKTLYYVKQEVVGDQSVGIELHSVSLDSKKDKILISKIKVDKNKPWQKSLNDFSLSNDNQKIAYVRDGVWIMDLKTNKTTKIATSTDYDPDKGTQGHSYNFVNWSPTGKYFHLQWSGYEVGGDEIMEVATKKITKLYSGFPGSYDLIAFIDDTRGVFTTVVGDIVEKEIANLKKDYPVLNLDESLGTHDVNSGDIGKVNGSLGIAAYSASQDRIYYIRHIIVKVKKEGGFVTGPQVVYFDRKKGKTIKISENLPTSSETNNLLVFADGKYVIYDLKSNPDDSGVGFKNNQIWVISTDDKTQIKLLDNALSPTVP